MRGISDWSVPIIVSSSFKEKLSNDRRFADAFFLVEYKRLKRIYRSTGNPRLSYMCGRGVADLGSDLHIRGSVGLGLLHDKLAEMLIASGASVAELNRAEEHLIAGRDQLEESPYDELIARALGQWYMLMAVTHKARGRISDYESLLRQGVGDGWLADHGTAGDRIPVVRQQVMMRQDLDAHMALIFDAHEYRYDRPLEYYRTLKRSVEFLANSGMASSVAALKREFVVAFGKVSRDVPLIAHISFAKNMAQISALEGDSYEATRAATAALAKARSAGLEGQVRQLRSLLHAIEHSDVRGALETFRV